MSPKILVIRFSSMGDIILTTPVLRALRNRFPESEIHYLTKEKFREAIEHHPVPAKFWFLKDSLSELIQKLQAERFDIIIDLHASLRSMMVRFQLNGDKYIFPKKSLQRWKFIKLRMGNPDSRHIVERYLSAVGPLGAEDDRGGLDFPLLDSARLKVAAVQKSHFGNRSYFAIVLSATWKTKKWPVSHFIRFLQSYALPFVLLGGPGEQAEAEEIMQAIPGGINMTGKCSLQESAAWLEPAKFVITHDTGLMHISAALKKMCFVIWGNTSPVLGMYPWRTEFYNLEVRGLNCRPCTHLGYAQCPKGHFACMMNNDPEKLADLVRFHYPVHAQ